MGEYRDSPSELSSFKKVKNWFINLLASLCLDGESES